MQLVRGGQTTININGELRLFFRNARGVCQGDLLSPLLFNNVVDALGAIIEGASHADHIHESPLSWSREASPTLSTLMTLWFWLEITLQTG
jgi:hypothetical protein